jgi:carboxyl-terminal processing protease
MGIEAWDHWRANRRWASGLLGAAMLLGCFHAAAREAPPEVLDLETRHRVIDDIDAAIRGRFAHWSALPGFDYDAAFAAYRADALNRPDRKAFSVRTEEFLASLNNGHTQFNDAALSAADPGDLGFRMRHIGGQWVVTEAWRTELPSASVVLTLDGRPIETVYGEGRARLNASNERTRRTLFTHYPALFPLAFDLGLADGTMVHVDRRVAASGQAPPRGFSHRWIVPGKIAYLKISTFGRAEVEIEARKVYAEAYAKARRVILDVRGNGGGNTPSRLGRDLLGADWRFWRLTAPSAPVTAAARTPPASPRYLVLVDRGCGSACEDFVMPFSLSAQAVLIGETTGGSSGQPWIKSWGNGMSLWVGARRQWFPDGREFEGVGVAPDVAIDLTAEDYRAGRQDRVLAKALSLTGTEPTRGR